MHQKLGVCPPRCGHSPATGGTLFIGCDNKREIRIFRKLAERLTAAPGTGPDRGCDIFGERTEALSGSSWRRYSARQEIKNVAEKAAIRIGSELNA